MNYLIENLIVSLAISSSILCWRKNRRASSAIAISLASGLVLTSYDMQVYHPFAMLFAAWVCLADFNGRRLSSIPVEGNEINHAIVYLYCLRVLVDLIRIGFLQGVDIMWAVNMVLLLTQLTLAAGSATGYASRINSGISSAWRYSYRVTLR